MINISMRNIELYWRNLSLNMIQAFQGIFLATTAWDFFLTVIIDSHRSLVLANFAGLASALIIIPWIAGIFVLLIVFLSFLMRRDSLDTKIMKHRVSLEYSIFVVIYSVLAVLAIINPVISWPVVLNYLVNVVWAALLIYFRTKVINGFAGKIDSADVVER